MLRRVSHWVEVRRAGGIGRILWWGGFVAGLLAVGAVGKPLGLIDTGHAYFDIPASAVLVLAAAAAIMLTPLLTAEFVRAAVARFRN
jgi:hypothetical protein